MVKSGIFGFPELLNSGQLSVPRVFQKLHFDKSRCATPGSIRLCEICEPRAHIQNFMFDSTSGKAWCAHLFIASLQRAA